MERIKNLGDENYRVMDWNKLIEQYPLHQTHQSGSGDGGGGGGDVEGGLYVKVMTDEQMEVLRRQISVYATICDQLVEMHKSMTAQNDLTGIRLGNPYGDPSIIYAGNSISARHRWTPTPVQLQVLERIFEEGSGTPSKEKIKDITSKLSKHGQISETNVYNWFQNRRARSKRKQWVGTSNNAESEVEVANEKKMKQEGNRSHEERTERDENVESHNPDTNLETGTLNFPSDGNLKSSASFSSLAWYDESFLRVDELLMEKMEILGSLSPRRENEGYNIVDS